MPKNHKSYALDVKVGSYVYECMTFKISKIINLTVFVKCKAKFYKITWFNFWKLDIFVVLESWNATGMILHSSAMKEKEILHLIAVRNKSLSDFTNVTNL